MDWGSPPRSWPLAAGFSVRGCGSGAGTTNRCDAEGVALLRAAWRLTSVRGENGYREYREADVRVVEVVRIAGASGGSRSSDPGVSGLSRRRARAPGRLRRFNSRVPDGDRAADRAHRRLAETRRGRRALGGRALGTSAERQDEEQSAVSDYMGLPSDLPAPEDDGAADHLAGLAMPPITLPGTAGGRGALDDFRPGRTVLYVYPLSGRPGVDLPEGWDALPGARGCTPEACGFRDHHAELRSAGAAAVFGLSSQSTDYQAELAARLGLPFELLSDPELEVADALRLPTFTADDRRLYTRLTLVVTDGRIEHAFYPIFPPDQHAAEVLRWLRERASRRA